MELPRTDRLEVPLNSKNSNSRTARILKRAPVHGEVLTYMSVEDTTEFSSDGSGSQLLSSNEVEQIVASGDVEEQAGNEPSSIDEVSKQEKEDEGEDDSGELEDDEEYEYEEMSEEVTISGSTSPATSPSDLVRSRQMTRTSTLSRGGSKGQIERIEQRKLDTRTTIIQELIASEKEYLDQLQEIIDTYAEPLTTSVDIDELDIRHVHKIDSTLVDLLDWHQIWAAELVEYDSSEPIAFLFKDLADHSKLYATFCGIQPQFLADLENSRRKHEQLAALLDQIQYEPGGAACGRPMGYFLMLPILHVCKYLPVCQGLLKNTPRGHQDYEELAEVVQKLNQTTEIIVKGKKILETLTKISELSVDVEKQFPKFKFRNVKDRIFVKEGDLELLTQENDQARVYLFSDCLLAGTMDSVNQRHTLSDFASNVPRFCCTEIVMIKDLVVKDLSANRWDEQVCKLGFKVVFPAGSLALKADSKDSRSSWFSEIQRCANMKKAGALMRNRRISMTHLTPAQAEVRGKEGFLAEQMLSKWRRTGGKNINPDDSREALSYDESFESGSEEGGQEHSSGEFTSEDEDYSHRFKEEALLRVKYEDMTGKYMPRVASPLPLRGPIKMATQELDPEAEALFFDTPFPAVTSNVSELLTLSRELHKMNPPEIVLIGEENSGKSTLLDSLVGMPLFAGTTTTKIVHLTMRNNPKRDKPAFLFPMVAGKGRGKGAVILEDIGLVREKLRQMMGSQSVATTIRFTIESATCWDVLFIDTPALSLQGDAMAGSILRECKEGGRQLLCVESSKSWKNIQFYQFVRASLDPQLQRTLFVYTKFLAFLQLFVSSRDFGNYVAQCPSSAHCYFVSLLPPSRRDSLLERDAFRRAVSVTDRALDATLEQFQFDRSIESQIGTTNLRKALIAHLLNAYQTEIFSHIPQALQSATTEKRAQMDSIRRGSSDVTEGGRIRGVVARHFKEFTKALGSLLQGNSSMGTIVRGFSQEDSGGAGIWRSSVLGSKALKIQSWVPNNVRLVGGAQMQRILWEFEEACSCVSMDLHSQDIGASNSDSDLMWERSCLRLACKGIDMSMTPLVEELCSRCDVMMEEICDASNQAAKRYLRNKGNTRILHSFCRPEKLSKTLLLALYSESMQKFRAHARAAIATSSVLGGYTAITRKQTLHEGAHAIFTELALDLADSLVMGFYEMIIVPLSDPAFVLGYLTTQAAEIPIERMSMDIFNHLGFLEQIQVEETRIRADLLQIEDQTERYLTNLRILLRRM